MNEGTVYLYPPTTSATHGPAIEYPNASDIRRREIPEGGIEFVNDKGKRVVSTLPYTVVWD